MEELKAKELVVKAGLDLIENGLIARTWGNVSCRVDENSFVITPSGRTYESLTPADIVLCSVADASYTGDIKPSSEREIHALMYRERSDANFVIHTHQIQASAVSVLDKTEIPAGLSSQGEAICIAEYGLPSTKKLCNGVAKALSKSKGKAIIMAHHGVVCFGRDAAEAFDIARVLENDSQSFIAKVYEEVSREKLENERDIFSYYCLRLSSKALVFPKQPQMLGCSRRVDDGFALTLDGHETTFRGNQENMPAEARIHAEIYNRRKDVNFITHEDCDPLFAASTAGTPLVPMLDDFAQIVGRLVLCSKSASPKDIVSALSKRAGVLIPGYGALCCAETQSDAHAVQLVMEKNAYAQITASLTGEPKALSFIDCLIMRTVYQLSYSKKSEEQAN